MVERPPHSYWVSPRLGESAGVWTRMVEGVDVADDVRMPYLAASWTEQMWDAIIILVKRFRMARHDGGENVVRTYALYPSSRADFGVLRV